MFFAHNWPRYGNAKVIETLENERDMYKFINDQTLNLINKGYTMDEIADMIGLPKSLTGILVHPRVLRPGLHGREGHVPEISRIL